MHLIKLYFAANSTVTW